MQITVIGTGFVGVVSAAVYASFGNRVFGLDIDTAKITSLRDSKVPFFEPQLEDLLMAQQKSGNLFFTTDYAEAIPNSDVVIVAVGTPSTPEGSADLRFVLAAVRSAAEHLKENAIVVIKSTVPPGTLARVSKELAAHTTKNFHVASVPEFLREGTAVHDTLHPDRVVIGAESDQVVQVLKELHKPLQAPVVVMNPSSAQMAKYAANAYLALRITFINQIADLCELNGADVEAVIAAIGHDKRIGSHYWYPGLGYGGSCFPKDVKELAQYSKEVGQGDNLFVKMHELNSRRFPMLLKKMATKLGGWEGKTVAILGLSFKPNTDDTREAPSLYAIPELLKAGASVRAFDPKAMHAAKQVLPTDPKLTFAQTIAQACTGADVVMVLIEWQEFLDHDFGEYNTSKTQWFIDTRNQFDTSIVEKWGYNYLGIGRGAA